MSSGSKRSSSHSHSMGSLTLPCRYVCVLGRIASSCLLKVFLFFWMLVFSVVLLCAFWGSSFLTFLLAFCLFDPVFFCLGGFLPSYPVCFAPLAGSGATAFLQGSGSSNSSSVLANRFIWFSLSGMYGRLGWKWRLVVPPSGFLNALASGFGLVALEWIVMFGEISC